MRRLFLNYLLLLTIGWLDYVTGVEVHFGSFYLLAVAVAAWSLRPRAVGVYVVATVLVWVIGRWLLHAHYSRTWMLYWNVINRTGINAIVATAVFTVKATLDRQRQLIRELGKASLSASQLRELIPVCRLCHTCQGGPAYEEKLRQFLHDNPDADALGGVCADCLRTRAERIANIPVEKYFPADAP